MYIYVSLYIPGIPWILIANAYPYNVDPRFWVWLATTIIVTNIINNAEIGVLGTAERPSRNPAIKLMIFFTIFPVHHFPNFYMTSPGCRWYPHPFPNHLVSFKHIVKELHCLKIMVNWSLRRRLKIVSQSSRSQFFCNVKHEVIMNIHEPSMGGFHWLSP